MAKKNIPIEIEKEDNWTGFHKCDDSNCVTVSNTDSQDWTMTHSLEKKEADDNPYNNLLHKNGCCCGHKKEDIPAEEQDEVPERCRKEYEGYADAYKEDEYDDYELLDDDDPPFPFTPNEFDEAVAREFPIDDCEFDDDDDEEIDVNHDDIHKFNVGNSNYSEHKIQPWDIWEEYNLNPWEADIVKRVLREKHEPGMSYIDSRIMDFQKIIHVARKCIELLEKQKRLSPLPF